MRVQIFLATLLALVLISSSVSARSPLQIDGLDSHAVVIRDSDGMVHILARTEHDLVFLQGWAHARDRLYQMDEQRRTASGTLAELLGAAALPSDVTLRTAGLRRAAERSLAVMSPEGLAALDAYAAGVNAYVATNPLPAQYVGLEIATFEPWTPVDSLVFAKALAFLLSLEANLEEELARTLAIAAYQAEFGPAAGAALFLEDVNRSAPFDPASTVPDASMSPAALTASATSASHDRLTVSADGIRPETLRMAREFLGRLETTASANGLAGRTSAARGTNEWAVSGAFTESGRPLLANDPHLPFGMPSIWHPVHLFAPFAGFDVIGASLPGTPFVILGHNRRIAWGAANHRMDDTDVFQESLVVKMNDPMYPAGLATVHDGNEEPVIPLPQVYRVNRRDGGDFDTIEPVPPSDTIPPFVLIVPRRNEGPIIQPPIIDADGKSGTAISLMYTGFSGTRELDAFRAFNLAWNLEDFVDGLQFFDVGSQNWAYADTFGNIAYFTSAEVPLRRDLQNGFIHGLPPGFIRDGSSSNTDWLPLTTAQVGQAIPFEILPFDEMPQIVNPPAGFFVNANNDPNGDTLDNNPVNQLRTDGSGGIRYISWKQQMGLRAGRITQLLRDHLALGPVTAEDMREIQADVIPSDVFLLRPILVAAFDAANATDAHPMLTAIAGDPRIAMAAERFRDWDGSMRTGLLEGFDAADVDGVTLPPTQDEIDASIAATLYTVWRSRLIANTIDATLGILPKPSDERALIGLGHLLRTFQANPDTGGIGASGLNFFAVPGVGDPETRRDIIVLRSLEQALDLLEDDAFANAFGNSMNQDDYRWGRLHRVVLPSLLGEPFTRPTPLGNPPGFATDGGYRTIDPGSLVARVPNAGALIYSDGASQRFVADFGAGRGRIAARSSLPGGASGDLFGNPLFYDNLLGQWLTNDTYPLRQRLSDVFRDTVEFLPVRPPRLGDGDDDGDDDD